MSVRCCWGGSYSGTGDAAGPFTNTITVDVQSALVTGDDSSAGFNSPAIAGLIEAVNAITLGGSYIVTWEAPAAGTQGVAGYEIRRNKTVVDLITGNFYALNFQLATAVTPFLYQRFLKRVFFYSVSALF